MINKFIPKFIDAVKGINLTEKVFDFYLDEMKDPQWNESSEATLQTFLPDLIKNKLDINTKVTIYFLMYRKLEL